MKYGIVLLVIPLVIITTFCKPKETEEKASQEIALATLHKAAPFAVVQLFTSQGCSSCPPADRLLDQIKKEYDNNVVVLSYHVDYWNRLGWKDPFSKKNYSDLQYAYGNKFGNGSVYTPQAVINGSLHFVGSNETKMKDNLSKFLKKPSENTIIISDILKSESKVTLNYKLTGNTNNKNLKVALVIGSRETAIKRGENGGKTLLNTNIVVQETTVDASNKTGTANLDIPEIVNKTDELSVIAFVQKENLVITGASKKKL